MTVSTTHASKDYTAAGAATFAVDFQYLDTTHVWAVVYLADGTTVDYEYQGSNSRIVSNVFTVSPTPTAGRKVRLERRTPKTQSVDLEFRRPMPSTTVEAELDRLALCDQELEDVIAHSLVKSVSDTSTVDLTMSSGNLSAAARVSATSGNQITVQADGLHVPAAVPETAVTVVDTATVNLTAGGTNGHQIQADVKVSATAGNQLAAVSDGLHVPAPVSSSVYAVDADGNVLGAVRTIAIQGDYSLDSNGLLIINAGSASNVVAPSNSVLPSLSGNAVIGSTLTVNPGSWYGSPSPSLSFVWLRDGAVVQSGATTTFLLSAADADTTISVQVNAENGVGAASATTAGVLIPAASGADPSTSEQWLTTTAGITAINAGISSSSVGFLRENGLSSAETWVSVGGITLEIQQDTGSGYTTKYKATNTGSGGLVGERWVIPPTGWTVVTNLAMTRAAGPYKVLVYKTSDTAKKFQHRLGGVITLSADLDGTAVPTISLELTLNQVADPEPVPVNTSVVPFSSASAWNTRIPVGATFESAGATRTAALLASGTFGFNVNGWTIPVAIASASDPFRTIQVGPFADLDMGHGSATFSFRCPASAVPDFQLDGHFLCIDETGTYVYEFWYCKLVSGVWRALTGVRTPLSGTGLGIENTSGVNPGFAPGFNFGAPRVYGGTALGGLLRQGEATSASPINHAFAAATPRAITSQSLIAPATKYPSAPDITGPIPMGAQFAIPRSVNLASYGWPAPVLKYATALQEFGLYITDVSSSPCLYPEGINGLSDGILLNGYASQRAVIHSLLRMRLS